MIYKHEIREKKARYTGPRPDLPQEEPKLARKMERYLENRRLDALLALANGWYPARYKGAPRIIIPCSNVEGVPYWQGRAMDDHELRYASPAATRDDSIVIVWPNDSEPRVGGVVVEGPMDALAAAEFGFVGVALMGNNPTPPVIAHLSTFARAFQPVYVLPDIDALEFGANVLCHLSQRGIETYMKAPIKKDLAEMSPKKRRKFLCE